MLLIIGLIGVIASVLGGFIMEGGQLFALNQPAEFVVLGGAGLFSLLAANTGPIVKDVIKGALGAPKGSRISKATYTDLLGLMASVFDVMRREGVLGIENDLASPHESARFKRYPKAAGDHHIMETFCGALRLFVDGVVNAFDLERLLDTEIETHHEEAMLSPGAVKVMADAFPAFGIVAAVLGVILTMQVIDQPPTVIGEKVGAALVGTMLGIFLSYGIFGPLGTKMEHIAREQSQILKTVQAGLVSFAGGAPPQVALEFARKTIPAVHRPTAEEMEELIKAAKKG